MVRMNYDRKKFKSDEEYKKFLDEKWLELKKKLDKPEIQAVFKRLADR
jgi:hypothetical protein